MKALHYLWSIPLAILLGALAGLFITAVTLVCGLLILRDAITGQPKTKDQRPKAHSRLPTHDSPTPD